MCSGTSRLIHPFYRSRVPLACVYSRRWLCLLRFPRLRGCGSPKLNTQTDAIVRLCLQAADLRAQHRSFREIAQELGLASPKDAQKAVQQGLALTPGDDVREVRRLEDMRLQEIARSAREIMLNPPPLAQLGKVVLDEEGCPIPG